MTKDDLRFLKNLQTKLINQSEDRGLSYWVIEDTQMVTCEEGHGELMVHVGKGLYQTPEEFTVEVEMTEDFHGIFEEWMSVNNDIFEVVKFVKKHFNYQNADVVWMEPVKTYTNMFLTKEACEKHIENNRICYMDPKPYQSRSWRSYELERFISLFKAFNFDKTDTQDTSAHYEYVKTIIRSILTAENNLTERGVFQPQSVKDMSIDDYCSKIADELLSTTNLFNNGRQD